MAERYDTERIKRDNPLSEYILRRGVALKQNGREWEACCPFHSEKTPSFQVFPSREGFQKFHCKGCGAFGNVIDFVQQYDGVEFPEACAILGGEKEAPNRQRAPLPAAPAHDPYAGFKVLPPPADAPVLTPGKRTPLLRNPKRDSDRKPFTTYTPSLVHHYRNADGSLIGYVLRVDIETAKGSDKITPLLLWCREANGFEGWTHHPMPTPRPLYGLERNAAKPGKQWWLGEGEKVADVLDRLFPNMVSMSWQGGGKSIHKSDWSPAKGKSIVVAMDNDAEGERTVLGFWDKDTWKPGLVELLHQAGAATVKVIGRDPDKKNGWDLADAHLEDGWNAAEIAAYAKARAQVWTMADIARRKADLKPAAPPPSPPPAPAPKPQMIVVDGGQAQPRPRPVQPERIVVKDGDVTTIRRVSIVGALDDEADTDLAGRWHYTKNKDDEEVIHKKSNHNRLVACRYHPDMKGVLAWNEFSAEVVFMKPPAWRKADPNWTPHAMTDRDAMLCAAWMEHKLGFTASANDAGAAMVTAAMESPYNPVREYLDGLVWDGVRRVQGEPNFDPWLTEYMAAHNKPINRAFGMRWLISAVARAYDPGCKVDTMLILEGKQGARKSSALKLLATLGGHAYFTDALHDVGSKDASMVMNGVWVAEVAELDAFGKAESKAIKAWLSRSTDRFRPPYGKVAVNLPRRSVLAGTTNENTYLKDPTGGRRFWPVKVRDIDLARLERDRDQLWAEAVALYKAGEPWWLQGDENTMAEKAQKARQQEDPWANAIDAILETKTSVTTDEIMEVLALPRAQQTQATQTRIANHLTAAGWGRVRKRVNGRRRYVFEPMGLDDEPADD